MQPKAFYYRELLKVGRRLDHPLLVGVPMQYNRRIFFGAAAGRMPIQETIQTNSRSGDLAELAELLISRQENNKTTAYDLAVSAGFQGDLNAWLASLVGPGLTIRGDLNSQQDLPSKGRPGDAYLVGDDLFLWNGQMFRNTGPVRGPGGKSAYQVAVDNGFVGTQQEWLASLQGPPGVAGGESWMYYATTWSEEPNRIGTVVDGDVFQYRLGMTTRFRLVPNPYSSVNDAFYAGYSSGQLTNLIVRRG